MNENVTKWECESSAEIGKVPQIFKILRNQPHKRKGKPEVHSPKGKLIEHVISPSSNLLKKRKKAEKKSKIIDTTSTKSHNSGTDEETSHKAHSQHALPPKNYTPETILVNSDLHDDLNSQENYFPINGQNRLKPNNSQYASLANPQSAMQGQNMRPYNWGAFQQGQVPAVSGVMNQMSQAQSMSLSGYPPIQQMSSNFGQHVNAFCQRSEYQMMVAGQYNAGPMPQSNFSQQRDPRQVPTAVAPSIEVEKNNFESEKLNAFSSDDEERDLFVDINRKKSIFLPSPNQAKIIDYHDYFDTDSDLKI